MTDRVVRWAACVLVGVVLWSILMLKGAPEWAAFGFAYLAFLIMRGRLR